MNKGTKLFGHSKETKEIDRNPVNLRRVRDFVARYSDPDELSFPDSEQDGKPVDEATQTFSFATEGRGAGQAKKTRSKENTLLTRTNRPSDSASAGSSQDGFPLIELPATNDDNEENSATAPTTEQILLTTEKSPIPFAFASIAPLKESEYEAELPLIQPIELDIQEEKAISAKDAVQRESATGDAPFTTGQGATFTIIDDVAAETETPRGTQISLLREKDLPRSRRAPELTLVSSPSNGEALKVEPVVAREEEQREKSGEPSQKKTISFLQSIKRRRGKKTRVHIGRCEAVVTENTGESDVLPKESARPNRREPATAQEFDTPGLSAKHEGGAQPHAVRKDLDGLAPCLVSFLAPDSFEAEQYRVLRHLVERLRGERGRSCIVAVSSPSAGDGKTTTALNLAGALAQAVDARVLLIDADLRRPAVLERLGGQLATNHGLVKAIQHPRLRLQNTTMQYAFLNLTILPAGHLTSSSYEIFKSPRFGALLEDARRAYDYIILDTPPLVPVPDCRLIAQWVDGFFVVVAAHKTPCRLVQEALSVLPDDKILGLVFNGDDPPVFGYEQYYGYSSLRATESRNPESLS